ncbi:MAG: class I SAM-dependent methyltransferase [Proteobacteria bacterium]|jgi:SAM-dependent methyltransferase|nr:class I SAM-dependent methyltransferase [Pseudomonadota bacterium]
MPAEPTVIDLEIIPKLGPHSFNREDEGDDAHFYREGRASPPLDELALKTTRELLGQLIVESNPSILDLAAGALTHLPPDLEPREVIGLGLDEPAMAANKALTETVVHDLNSNPVLPFKDRSFDIVLSTFSMAYLTRPFEVFEHVGRVLKPGGLFVVLFTNRHVRRKAVQFWIDAPEHKRSTLVRETFEIMGVFDNINTFHAIGRPRPEEDRFVDCGLPSDPIYAVWGELHGGDNSLLSPSRPVPASIVGVPLDREAIAQKEKMVSETLCCPYCDQALTPWPVPQTPFTEWACEEMFVCLNNRCPYLCRGWSVMDRQGNSGYSYRLMYNPDLKRCMPVPVPNARALREDKVLPRG